MKYVCVLGVGSVSEGLCGAEEWIGLKEKPLSNYPMSMPLNICSRLIPLLLFPGIQTAQVFPKCLRVLINYSPHLREPSYSVTHSPFVSFVASQGFFKKGELAAVTAYPHIGKFKFSLNFTLYTGLYIFLTKPEFLQCLYSLSRLRTSRSLRILLFPSLLHAKAKKNHPEE